MKIQKLIVRYNSDDNQLAKLPAGLKIPDKKNSRHICFVVDSPMIRRLCWDFGKDLFTSSWPKQCANSSLAWSSFQSRLSARDLLLNVNVVQLLVRLAPSPAVVDEVLYALQGVMRGAQQARGCRFAQICRQIHETSRIEYSEEWDNEGELRCQFGSERFLHLLSLVETAEEPPVIEFRVISETYGLEYTAATRRNDL